MEFITSTALLIHLQLNVLFVGSLSFKGTSYLLNEFVIVRQKCLSCGIRNERILSSTMLYQLQKTSSKKYEILRHLLNLRFEIVTYRYFKILS
jgi:hypothetical protein